MQRAKRIGALPATVNFMYDKSCDMWSLGVILYILLCGYPPFQSEIPGSQLSEAMKDAIKRGKYTFHEKYWGHISAEAKDLVRALLCTNPLERMTAVRLSDHPWIRGQEVAMTPLMTPGALHGSAEERAAALREMEENLMVMRKCKPMTLKPLNKCKDKLSQRRNKDSSVPMDTDANVAVQAPLKQPRELLAEFCLMPPPNYSTAQLQALTCRTVQALSADSFGPVSEVGKITHKMKRKMTERGLLFSLVGLGRII